jgi:hypothetical protein
VETIEYAYEHCTGCGCPEQELDEMDAYENEEQDEPVECPKP